MRIYLSTLFSLAILLILSLLVAHVNEINLFQQYTLKPAHLLIGLAALGLKLGYLFLRLARNDFSERKDLQVMVPRSEKEKSLFVLLCAAAGVTEEIAYRGIGFLLFSWLLRSPWLGALASAAAFGLAHQVQGRRAIVAVTLHGLIDQLVVHLTGTLYIVMVIHFVYDLIAGFSLSTRLQPSSQTA